MLEISSKLINLNRYKDNMYLYYANNVIYTNFNYLLQWIEWINFIYRREK